MTDFNPEHFALILTRAAEGARIAVARDKPLACQAHYSGPWEKDWWSVPRDIVELLAERGFIQFEQAGWRSTHIYSPGRPEHGSQIFSRHYEISPRGKVFVENLMS